MGRPPDCSCFCTPDEPPPPSCPHCPGWYEQFQVANKKKFLVIQVCNTNSARDDDFIVYLNGTQIDAYLDLNANSKVGAIYKSDAVTIDDDDPLLLCKGENHTQSAFDPTILNANPTDNVITASQAQNNNNGNYGRIRILSYDYPYVRGQGCQILDEPYGGANTWNFTFDLCPKGTIVKFLGTNLAGDPVPNYQAQFFVNGLGQGIASPGDEFAVTVGDVLKWGMIDDGCHPPNTPSHGLWWFRKDGGAWINTMITTNPDASPNLTLEGATASDLIEISPDYTCQEPGTATITLERYFWQDDFNVYQPGHPPPPPPGQPWEIAPVVYEAEYTVLINGVQYSAGNVVPVNAPADIIIHFDDYGTFEPPIPQGNPRPSGTLSSNDPFGRRVESYWQIKENAADYARQNKRIFQKIELNVEVNDAFRVLPTWGFAQA